MPQALKIFALNPNGIRAYLKKAHDDLKKLQETHKPDVLFFIETKMNSKPETVTQVEKDLNKALCGDTATSYKYYWSHCQRPGRHGTGVAVREDLNVQRVRYNIDLTLSENSHEIEGRTLTVELDDTIIVGLYVVNASQELKRLKYKEEWNTQLASYLRQLRLTNPEKRVIVIGDLNVANENCDIANPESNKKVAGFTDEERKQFKALLAEGWIDVWRDKNPIENPDKSLGNEGIYTFWNTKSRARSRNAGWRIDYVLCDNPHYQPNLFEPFILCDSQGSDHCPIGLYISGKD